MAAIIAIGSIATYEILVAEGIAPTPSEIAADVQTYFQNLGATPGQISAQLKDAVPGAIKQTAPYTSPFYYDNTASGAENLYIVGFSGTSTSAEITTTPAELCEWLPNNTCWLWGFIPYACGGKRDGWSWQNCTGIPAVPIIPSITLGISAIGLLNFKSSSQIPLSISPPTQQIATASGVDVSFNGSSQFDPEVSIIFNTSDLSSNTDIPTFVGNIILNLAVNGSNQKTIYLSGADASGGGIPILAFNSTETDGIYTFNSQIQFEVGTGIGEQSNGESYNIQITFNATSNLYPVQGDGGSSPYSQTWLQLNGVISIQAVGTDNDASTVYTYALMNTFLPYIDSKQLIYTSGNNTSCSFSESTIENNGTLGGLPCNTYSGSYGLIVYTDPGTAYELYITNAGLAPINVFIVSGGGGGGASGNDNGACAGGGGSGGGYGVYTNIPANGAPLNGKASYTVYVGDGGPGETGGGSNGGNSYISYNGIKNSPSGGNGGGQGSNGGKNAAANSGGSGGKNVGTGQGGQGYGNGFQGQGLSYWSGGPTTSEGASIYNVYGNEYIIKYSNGNSFTTYFGGGGGGGGYYGCQQFPGGWPGGGSGGIGPNCNANENGGNAYTISNPTNVIYAGGGGGGAGGGPSVTSPWGGGNGTPGVVILYWGAASISSNTIPQLVSTSGNNTACSFSENTSTSGSQNYYSGSYGLIVFNDPRSYNVYVTSSSLATIHLLMIGGGAGGGCNGYTAQARESQGSYFTDTYYYSGGGGSSGGYVSTTLSSNGASPYNSFPSYVLTVGAGGAGSLYGTGGENLGNGGYVNYPGQAGSATSITMDSGIIVTNGSKPGNTINGGDSVGTGAGGSEGTDGTGGYYSFSYTLDGSTNTIYFGGGGGGGGYYPYINPPSGGAYCGGAGGSGTNNGSNTQGGNAIQSSTTTSTFPLYVGGGGGGAGSSYSTTSYGGGNGGNGCAIIYWGLESTLST